MIHCFTFLVLLVDAVKIHFEEQVLETSTKQINQASQAG
jgi:hypothetical protein